jgi:hypothetical protein
VCYAHGVGTGFCGFSGFQPYKTANFKVAFPRTEVLGKPLILVLIGRRGPYPGACSGKIAATRTVLKDLCILVWTQEPAHRFAGESIIIFLSNEDTGKQACFDLDPGYLRL